VTQNSDRSDAGGAGGVPPRCVVLSRRQASQHVWQASQYEFEDVIAEVDDVHLLMPDADRPGELGQLVHGAGNRVRKALGRPRRSTVRPTTQAVDAELFFAVFAAPHEIADLRAVQPQLARSAKKIAFLIEMWSTQVERSADHLRQLRGFDHVYVFNRHVIPAVERITGVPTSYIPHAADALRFAPHSPAPERSVDVMSYGRRMHVVTHRALVDALEDGRLTYLFDTVKGPFETLDYRDHRLVLAARLQRSRFAVVHKISDTTAKLGMLAGEDMLTTRYFEVVASGAVMLGTAPDLQDFRDSFDWPDALIPIEVPEPGIVDLVTGLTADSDRIARASTRNVVESLRRHDWSYRWAQILQEAGLEPRPALAERHGHLASRADQLETIRS